MKKIVIQMHMESEKFRRKAMKIAAAFQGVVSVSLDGESKDQLVVTGEQVDCVCLTNKLRKKFCSANILSVEDANTSASNEAGGEQKDDEKTNDSKENPSVDCCEDNYHPPCPCPSYYIVYDPYPNSCVII